MGIFSRISDIIASNVHALLDQAEDPERMIGQIIREMEEGLARAKQDAVAVLAAERQTRRELDRNRAESQRWQGRACEALVSGREDLARRALARKLEHDDLVRGLEVQHAEAAGNSDRLKKALRALEARLAEARRKQRALAARHRTQKVRATLQRIGGSVRQSANQPLGAFDRLEARLDGFQDQVDARLELDQPADDADAELTEPEWQRRLDEELTALKVRIASCGEPRGAG